MYIYRRAFLLDVNNADTLVEKFYAADSLTIDFDE